MTLQFPIDRISIRPAEESDVRWGADLMFSSGPALFSYVFAVTADKAQDILRQAFAAPRHAFSYEHAQILEVDNQPAGLIIGYRGDTKRKAEEQIQGVMANIVPLQRVPRILVNLADLSRIKQNVEKDEYFVLSLCIADEYRDRGLGTALLQDAELCAQDLKCKTICLDLAYTNLRARAWLTRLGYHVTCSKTSQRFSTMTDAGGLHRMEKRLSP
jgi:ribosomal protein S18 acetylase RimI-like enzyme